MKQDLEKILREKRLKLDVEEPENDLIWEGIRSGLRKRKHLPDWFWKAAAIFIFVISATYFVANERSKKQVVVLTLSDISSELGKQEQTLKQQVNLKWEEVEQQLPDNDPEIQFLLQQLNDLDAIYTTYQKDLNRTLDNEPVIRAMLDYYEKKTRILNRLLMETEKQKQVEKDQELSEI